MISSLNWISKPAILIAGGKNKSQKFEILENIFKQKVKLLIPIGASGKKLRELAIQWGISLPKDNLSFSLKSAFMTAMEFAKEGDVILYSPGCSNDDPEFSSAEECGIWIKSILEGGK